MKLSRRREVTAIRLQHLPTPVDESTSTVISLAEIRKYVEGTVEYGYALPGPNGQSRPFQLHIT